MERDPTRVRVFGREGTHTYFCRHAERLDSVFPNWHNVIQSDPSHWPPGFVQSLPFSLNQLPFLRSLHVGDCPITARGCHQARASAESLRNSGIAHIFSSPMLRCMQTAMEFSQVLGLPIKVEPAAMEAMDERWYPIIPTHVNWNSSELAKTFNVDTSYKSPFTFPTKHERISDFTDRCLALLQFMTRDEFLADGPVLMITHGIIVALLPFTICSLRPPHFGYCILSEVENRPFSTIARVGTAQLESPLPAEIIAGSGGGVPCLPMIWLACATGVETDSVNRVYRWTDHSSATVADATAALTSSFSKGVVSSGGSSSTLSGSPNLKSMHSSSGAADMLLGSRMNVMSRLSSYAGSHIDCHAVQPRESVRPVHVRAVSLRRVPVVSFDGNGQHLVAPISGTFRSFTVATLVRPKALPDLHVLLTADPYKDAHGLEIRIDRLGSVGVFAGDIAAVVARNAVDVDRWVLIVLRVQNGKEARLWIDYTRAVVGGSLRGLCPAFGPWQGLYIGGGSPVTGSFNGSIAELVAFPEGLSDDQIDKLHAYFITKFA